MTGLVTGAVCLGLLAAPPSPARATRPADGQVFRAAVDGVRVDVLVRDRRRIVSGLTVRDFELRDRGVLQKIESVAFEDAPLSVMLVLDTSASVQGDDLVHLREAARAVVDLLRPADRVALMTFNGAVTLVSGWTADHGQVNAALERVSSDGGTALHDAAYAAIMLRDPAPGRALVMVFSDGADSGSWLPGSRVIELAQRHETVVYGVTMGDAVDRPAGYRLDFVSGPQPRPGTEPQHLLRVPFVDGLAEETGGAVLPTRSSDTLREAFVQIVTEFRSRYVLTYVPLGGEAGGWHPLEVKLKGRSGTVTARRGYLR